jgi:regulator of ribonuclease activity A
MRKEYFVELKTTDLCDAYSDELQIVDPIFSDYGGCATFSGPIATIKTFEDNTLVRAAVESPGEGQVLVVDAGGSMRCAMFGDNLAALAVNNGWSGVVMYGCIRDSDDIGKMDVGLKALATHPLKSVKANYGQRDVPLQFAGVTFTPGHYLYADRDGIVVAERALTLD